MKFRLSLLILLCASSAQADWYICSNEKKTSAMSFGHDDQKVVVGHMSFAWSMWKNHHDSLTENMPGGSYNLKKNEDKITLRYIQDSARRIIGLPSGEIVKDENEIWYDMYDGKYEFIDVYHGIFPVVNELVFDLNSPNIIRTYYYDFSPRKISKRRWTFDTESRMGEEEQVDRKSEIFKKREKKVFPFPDCKKESGLKGLLRYIINIFSFP